MKLKNLIDDVAIRLNSHSDICGNKKEEGRILRGFSRLLDEFSIDGRKLPVVQPFEFKIRESKHRYAIGSTGDLCMYMAPHTIYHAEWLHVPECGCTVNSCCPTHTNVQFSTWLGGHTIRINNQVDNFFRTNHHHDNHHGNGHFFHSRPSEMWYQQSAPNGEIVFNHSPSCGEVLSIRATVPFDDRILKDCIDEKPCKKAEFEFVITPCDCLTIESRQCILMEAQNEFTGCDDFCFQTQGTSCDPCADPIDVVVTVRRQAEFYTNIIEPGQIEFPPGYYSAFLDILAYKMAPGLGLKETSQLVVDKNQAMIRLHRNNERPAQVEEIDHTLPWSNRHSGGASIWHG